MSRCTVVGLLAAFVLCTIAGAVEFGLDLGSRAAELWPVGYNNPENVRGGAGDLLADVPLSKVFSVNLRAGGFTSTNELATRQTVVNLFGLDGRVALLATASIVKDAVSAYAGVGATYDWFRYGGSGVIVYYQRGITLGVPAGLKLRLSRRVTACVEMEVPDYGLYWTAASGAPEQNNTWSWSQYGSVEPSVSAALYLVH